MVGKGEAPIVLVEVVDELWYLLWVNMPNEYLGGLCTFCRSGCIGCKGFGTGHILVRIGPYKVSHSSG